MVLLHSFQFKNSTIESKIYMTVPVTGCAEFIGSNLVHTWLTSSDETILNIGKLHMLATWQI